METIVIFIVNYIPYMLTVYFPMCLYFMLHHTRVLNHVVITTVL